MNWLRVQSCRSTLSFCKGRFPLTRIVSRSIPIADTVIGYWYWIRMTLSGIAHRCGSQRGRQSRPSRTRQWRRRGWKCRISIVSAAETITPAMSSSTVSSPSEVLLRATAAQPLKAKPRTCLRQVDALLASAGTSKTSLLTATVYLSNMADKDGMNEAWRAWLDPVAKPTRATVQTVLGTPDTRRDRLIGRKVTGGSRRHERECHVF